MSVRRGFVVFLLMVILYSFSVSAATFEVEVIPVTDEITFGQYATFQLVLTNLGTTKSKLEFQFPDDPRWSVEIDPLQYLSEISLSAHESKEVIVKIKPLSTMRNGRYTYTFQIQSASTDELVSKGLPFFVSSNGEYSGYLPVVNVDIDIADKIIPLDPTPLRFTLNNKNRLNISDLDVIITSTLFNVTKTVDLEPLGTYTEEVMITYDPSEQPLNDTLTVMLRWKNLTQAPFRKTIEIIPYAKIEEKTEQKSSWLKYESILTYSSRGNVNGTKEVEVETTTFRRIFTSTLPEPELIEREGKTYYHWSLVIEPQETKQVQIILNYRPLLMITLLIIGSIGAYYYFRSPLTVKKEAIILRQDDHGISKVKVLIHVKNRTAQTVDEVKVIDRTAQITDLERDVEIGTLAPEKVLRNEKEGTVIRWQLTHLEPFEERIITYVLSSKFKIIGNLNLPAVVVKYKNRKGNSVKIHSNRAITSAPQERKKKKSATQK